MRAPPKIKIVQSRPTPSLPVELLNEIFALCSTKTQKKLSLLSRSFLHIVRPHLFATICIDSEWHFEVLVTLVTTSDTWAGYIRSLKFPLSYLGSQPQSSIANNVRFAEVLRRCLQLRHLIVEPPANPSPSIAYTETESSSVNQVAASTDVISAILTHPSLRTFEVGAVPSAWIKTCLVASSSPPSQRSYPLLLPELCLTDQDVFHPVLNFVAHRGIHVRKLDLHLAADQIHALQSVLSLSVPSLEVLHLDFITFQIPKYTIPADLFLSLLTNYPSLQTVSYQGGEDWIGIGMWTRLSEVEGLESLAGFEMDFGWSNVESFQISFVRGADSSILIEGFSIAVVVGPPESLNSFLRHVHACFPDLKTLDLGECSFDMPRVGTLQLPRELLPNLQHLSLPPIEFEHSSSSLSISLQSSSCLLHPNPDFRCSPVSS